MKNVLMIDEVSSIKEVLQYLKEKKVENINIKYTTSDGKDAINILKNNIDNIDIIVMELVIPSIDGIGILKYLKKEKINKKIIIYSNITLNNMGDYNNIYFLYKNVGIDILIDRINDIVINNIDNTSNRMNKEISKLLHNLGMPSHIKGYQYVRDSICLMYENHNDYGGITTNVYPFIADKYQTTPSRVERAIRHAIEVSWSRGDYDLMEEIFGHSVDFDRAKPTNSEFLATITDKLCMESFI